MTTDNSWNDRDFYRISEIFDRSAVCQLYGDYLCKFDFVSPVGGWERSVMGRICGEDV